MTPEQEAKIIQMRNLGVSYRDIEKYIGVPKSTAFDFMSDIHKRSKAGSKTKIICISDLHCGSYSGLTPPKYWPNKHFKPDEYTRMEKTWIFYTNTLESLGKVDYCFCLSDCIDGKGSKNGGVELITTDLLQQAKMAVDCIKMIDCDKVFMVRGTAYHTSTDGNCIEDIIADDLDGAVIDDYLNVNVNGIVFNLKHKISSSSILAGRVAPLVKEYQWAVENDNEITPSIFLRGHVHYHVSVFYPGKFLGITLPALQLPFSQYGNQQCTGQVDTGMVYMEVPSNCADVQDVYWKSYLMNTKEMEKMHNA